MSGWLYLGCGHGPGHYLFGEDRSRARLPERLERRLEILDGKLAPQPERLDQLYQAAMSRLGGLGYSALSWWDRSVDGRGGSNSTIFAPDLEIGMADMLEEGRRRFPWVFARTPQPVRLRPWRIEGAEQ